MHATALTTEPAAPAAPFVEGTVRSAAHTPGTDAGPASSTGRADVGALDRTVRRSTAGDGAA